MPSNEVFLPARDVRKRYGGASDMWLWRRLHNPASQFPQPTYFGRFRFWRLSDLEAWERACAVTTTEAA
jgi:predicted DNA-binding transcriptional regulator AlpA